MEEVLSPSREHEMTSASLLRRGCDPLHRKLELIDGSLRVLCRVLDGSPGRPTPAAKRTISAHASGAWPNPFCMSADTGRGVASTMALAFANNPSRVNSR